MNDSLISLKLDFNRSLGSDGLVALSKGLKLNNTLKFLSLKFCGIGLRGGAALSDIIAFPRTAIESLDLEGNSLGGKGLEHFCPGLKSNNTLQKLSLADIHILPTDALSMQIFGDAIANHKTLTEVNLLRNILGETGGSELLKHLQGNSKIQSFLVDANLPSDIYLSLCRTVSQPHKKVSKKKRKAKKGSKKK
jgi:Ran GTPase-activating protein (RanGAP) involved in mRNA processing and transport